MKNPFALIVALAFSATAHPGPAVDDLLAQYKREGAGPFSAIAGRGLWEKPFSGSGDQRACSSCHTADPRRKGRHVRTGKAIEPLAPSVNPVRLTDRGKLVKWLDRNCRWTLGRECTAQEKGDLLLYLRAQ